MKALLKASALFVLMAVTASQAYVEERDTVPRKWDVGLGVGQIGGMGVSMRRWFDPKNALQVNFAPFYWEEKYPEDSDDGYYSNTRDSGYSNKGFLSLGAIYLHRMGEYNGFYLTSFGGGSYTATFNKADYYETSYSTSTVEHHVRNTVEGTVSVGGGLGGGFEFWRLDASVLVGLAGAYDLAKETKQLTPSLDVALHFHL